MSEVKLYKWHREKIMTMEQIIRFQVVSYCCIENIKLTKGETEALIWLGINAPIAQAQYCKMLSAVGLFSTPLSARNTVGDLHSKGLIVKEGKVRKMLTVHPQIGIVNKGVVMVDIKCITENYRSNV